MDEKNSAAFTGCVAGLQNLRRLSNLILFQKFNRLPKDRKKLPDFIKLFEDAFLPEGEDQLPCHFQQLAL